VWPYALRSSSEIARETGRGRGEEIGGGDGRVEAGEVLLVSGDGMAGECDVGGRKESERRGGISGSWIL